MFAGPVGRDLGAQFDAAERIYREYGIALTFWPYRARPVAEAYQPLLDMTGSINTNDDTTVKNFQGWARHCYPLQVTYMCPVVFCRLASGTSAGSTRAALPDHPRSLAFVDWKRSDRGKRASLAHEIGHAAGLSGQGLQPKDAPPRGAPQPYMLPGQGHALDQENLMWPTTDITGTKLTGWQVDIIRKAYFARSA
jgi:hypothetical protein